MSIMHFDTISAISAEQLVVSLSGGSVLDTDLYSAYAGFQFRLSGDVYKYQGGTTSQIQTATDWIRPIVSFTPSDYEIRATLSPVTGDSPTSTGDSLDTWHSLGTQRNFYLSVSNAYKHSQTGFYIDIRHATDSFRNTQSSVYDSAACMASATYSITLIVEEGFF